jgi:alpha-tubulin suppressor-like RCC1 family protein
MRSPRCLAHFIAFLLFTLGSAVLQVSGHAQLSVPASELSVGGVAITAGNGTSCAVLSNRTAQCWGDNSFGEIGNGTTSQFLYALGPDTPVLVSGIDNVVAIGAGESHTCALLSDNTVRCWGYNGNGQLGNGTVSNASTPVPVSGLNTATAISVGSNHTCARLADGTAQCWGDGSGASLNLIATSPVPVAGLNTVTAVSAGGNHSCALLSDTTVQCWGSNLYGQLGNGTTVSSSAPVAVSGLTGVAAISARVSHTCALLLDGTVECWGYNNDGELGNATTGGSTTPVAVSGLSGVAAISDGAGDAGGGSHTCALLLDGTVQCWGFAIAGTNTNSSVPVVVSGLSGVVAVSAGEAHTCALLSDTSMRCWGSNAAGQLGNRTRTDSSVPVPVVTGPKALTAMSISASVNPSLLGQPVTFTANFTHNTPPEGELVTFKRGTIVLGTVPQSGGSASFTTSSLPVGIDPVIARYGGDNFLVTSFAFLKQVVTKYPTTTQLTSSANPSVYGQSVKIMATITSTGSSTPTGLVVFRNGTLTVGAAHLDANGVATLTSNRLPVGTLAITAIYYGDSRSAASTSAPFSQTVNQIPTFLTLDVLPNPTLAGERVQLTARIQNTGIFFTGSVVFTLGGVTLGTAPVGGGNEAIILTTALPKGTDIVTATYSGTTNFAGATATANAQVN